MANKDYTNILKNGPDSSSTFLNGETWQAGSQHDCPILVLIPHGPTDPIHGIYPKPHVITIPTAETLYLPCTGESFGTLNNCLYHSS